MTSIQTNILLGQLLTRSIQISDECEMLADYLSFRAEIAKRKRMISRGVNVLIGGLAFAAAYIQPLPKILGNTGIKIIGLIAAIILVLDGIAPVILGDDTFERLSEYSYYLYSFSSRLRNTLADESFSEQEKQARLAEILSMATKNLDDVRAKWPMKVSRN